MRSYLSMEGRTTFRSLQSKLQLSKITTTNVTKRTRDGKGVWLGHGRSTESGYHQVDQSQNVNCMSLNGVVRSDKQSTKL
jgi:hypothetical protein